MKRLVDDKAQLPVSAPVNTEPNKAGSANRMNSGLGMASKNQQHKGGA